jgi:hypothetical protein
MAFLSAYFTPETVGRVYTKFGTGLYSQFTGMLGSSTVQLRREVMTTFWCLADVTWRLRLKSLNRMACVYMYLSEYLCAGVGRCDLPLSVVASSRGRMSAGLEGTGRRCRAHDGKRMCCESEIGIILRYKGNNSWVRLDVRLINNSNVCRRHVISTRRWRQSDTTQSLLYLVRTCTGG